MGIANKIQNSDDSDSEVVNTVEFSEAFRELLKKAARYAQFAQSTRQAFIRLLMALSSGSLLALISLLKSWISADTVWLALLPISWGFLLKPQNSAKA